VFFDIPYSAVSSWPLTITIGAKGTGGAAVAIGSSGNIAAKFNWGNTPDFDGLTSGIIVVEIAWSPK
jgi:hypothetical protein